jgi:hypothetical protein
LNSCSDCARAHCNSAIAAEFVAPEASAVTENSSEASADFSKYGWSCYTFKVADGTFFATFVA